MTASTLRLDALTKRFGDINAVHELDLDVEAGELMVLVGPSGSGKSTVLRLIAGLEDPTSGAIEIAGRNVSRVAARDRDVAMTFQDYALYPHMTCFENIAYGLKVRRVPKADIAERVQWAARLLGVEELLPRRPETLSGGQRQRVAMGRAIARHPALYLMDEPLSNLDARLRTHMRTELAALQQRLGITTIFVTHDQVEAMTMGDRVAVLRAGRLQQLAPPTLLYDAPANVFVAGFIGTPAMNFVHGTIHDRDVSIGATRIGVRVRASSANDAIVGIRPEDLMLEGPEPTFRGEVRVVELLGNEAIVHVDVPGKNPDLPELADVAVPSETLATASATLRLAVRVPTGTALPAGGPVAVSIRPAAAHVFDATSHTAIPTTQNHAVAAKSRRSFDR